MILTARDLGRIKPLHADLSRVVKRAAELMPDDLGFMVVQGMRTIEQQREYVKRGASWTMDSRHLTGHAVDLGAMLDGELRWDWPLYRRLAATMKHASLDCNIPIRWGGTWSLLSTTSDLMMCRLHATKPDGPHFELPASLYPAEAS